MLEDENFRVEIYIEPNDREYTDEDSGIEGGGGLLDNLCCN